MAATTTPTRAELRALCAAYDAAHARLEREAVARNYAQLVVDAFVATGVGLEAASRAAAEEERRQALAREEIAERVFEACSASSERSAARYCAYKT